MSLRHMVRDSTHQLRNSSLEDKQSVVQNLQDSIHQQRTVSSPQERHHHIPDGSISMDKLPGLDQWIQQGNSSLEHTFQSLM
jgi:hypothetical protein